MDIKKMVSSHQKTLDQKASQTKTLSEKLRECREGGDMPQRCAKIRNRLRSLIIIYAMIIMFFTATATFFLDQVKKEDSVTTQPVLESGAVFQAHFPGSISQAIEEVFKWEE